MPKNDIGGFFVSLGLNIDRDSFETGNKLIDGVGNSFNKLIGSARNAAVVLAGTAVATGSVESAAYKMSEKLNISTESLDLWKATAKIAGVDANGLISAMGRMANVLDHMKVDGTGLQEFTKQLGKLGIVTDDIDIEKMLNMAPDELMTEILRKAQEASAKAKKDIAEAKKALELNPNDTEAQTKLTEAQDVQRQVLTIVRDNLGDEGQGLFIELERQGKTIDELHSLAKQTIFTDRTTNADANNFMEQVRVTKTLSENITKLLGSDIAKGLTPALTELNTWLLGHGDDIKNAMSSLAGAIEKVIGNTIDFITDEDVQEAAKEVGGAVKDSIEGALNTTKEVGTKLIEGDLPGAGQALLEGAKNTIGAPVERIVTVATNGNETVQNYKEETGQSSTAAAVNTGVRSIPGLKWIAHGTDFVMNKLGVMSDEEYEANTAIVTQPKKEKKKKAKKEINDGIMRPDGTVTQVAPDDWVLAARNLGDLAKAFVPEEKQKSITEPVQNTAPAYRQMPIAKEKESTKEIRTIEKQTPVIMNQEAPAPISETRKAPEKEQRQSPIVIKQEPAPVIEERKAERESPVQTPVVSIKENAPTAKQEPAPEVIQKQIVAPAESEAPRIVPKDETPINNFVSQQPQPQVATDNWSIVAKTISDLARSFIQPQPQVLQQSAGEYTINQTFNISGGNDMPQIIRQQAYRGTQDGLLEIMQQSSQRLQLMSGTR